MKAKLIGLIVLILVIAGAVGYTYYQKNSRTEQISGYVGGEKIGLLEDEEVKKILRSKYHLTVNYYKAGSLDMVTADKTGKDYLFPSSQTALELYEEKFGKPEKSEIILNTPIVIYTQGCCGCAHAAGYCVLVGRRLLCGHAEAARLHRK